MLKAMRIHAVRGRQQEGLPISAFGFACGQASIADAHAAFARARQVRHCKPMRVLNIVSVPAYSKLSRDRVRAPAW
jgi:hypothetical protein